FAVGTERAPLLGCCIREKCTCLRRETDERPGFHALDPRHAVESVQLGGRPFLGGKIEYLSADHAGRTARLSKAEHQAGANSRLGMRRWPRHELESKGQKPITREDRSRLVERLPHGRLATAQLVIVHGGEIVVNE